VIIGLANGKLFVCQEHLEPNADGSVHIPNSDQKPGKNIACGKVLMAFRLASSHICSLEK
jgi:hypothetical protein